MGGGSARDRFTAARTCAGDRGEDPALAVADGAALRPLAQDVAAADPPARVHPVGDLVPLPHHHATVVVAVDLAAESTEMTRGAPPSPWRRPLRAGDGNVELADGGINLLRPNEDMIDLDFVEIYIII